MKNKERKDKALEADQEMVKNTTVSFSRRMWQMYIQVGSIGLFIALVMWYALSTGSRIAEQYSPLVDAAMEIKLEATYAHLWFEEIISGDKHEEIEKVWNHIDQAEWYAQAMLKGGQNDENTFIPLDDSELRQSIEEVLEKIRDFRAIAKERLAKADESLIGSDIDQRFDSVFNGFLKQADNVETSLIGAMDRDQQRFQLVQSALIVLCLILTGVIGAILHRFQRRQSINLEAIRASNQQLQAANQQLRASEQQLKASNQQLQASEQQLRAANQQLRGSEQQLKASNQQLKASEQQLKATNQQLRASEQQLKASNHNLGERVKELQCMYGVTESINTRETVEEIFQDVAELVPSGWHYPEITRGKIIFDGIEYLSEPFAETAWKQTSDIIVNGKSRGSIEVYYLKECPELDEGPFMTEERNLINGMAKAISEAIERKQAAEEIEHVTNRLQVSIEQMPIAYILWDADQKVLEWNKSAENIFGYSSEEIVREKFLELIVPDAVRYLVDDTVTQLFSGIPSSYSEKDNNIRKDGKLISCLWHNTPIQDKTGKITAVLSMIQDITETRRLQELESRAGRLEMAGTIAGQVAHDFNNLLAPILAYPEFIREELPHDHESHAYLDDIEDAATKIASINQDLLTMGRRGHYNQEVLDLNRVVLRAAQEMESRTKTVAIEMKLCEGLLKIKGGSAQIHRLLTNLLVNAQDSMGDVGKITIKTENYYADDTSIAFGRVPKGEYVKLTISDVGCGIPDDIIQKIFDPFFSTKAADKRRGSGLGLSVVDAVIKDHNGHLDLSSKIGQGTSMYIYFPVTREGAAESELEHLAVGTESVLVVDDDEVQRKVSSKLLKKLGYEVDTAISGEEAVEFLRKNQRDIVILDMVMPGGIDGTDTYRQILESCPNQKAIILSGFSESDRVLEVQKLGAGAFIRKPVTKDIIAAAVRTELDRKRNSVTS